MTTQQDYAKDTVTLLDLKHELYETLAQIYIEERKLYPDLSEDNLLDRLESKARSLLVDLDLSSYQLVACAEELVEHYDTEGACEADYEAYCEERGIQ